PVVQFVMSPKFSVYVFAGWLSIGTGVCPHALADRTNRAAVATSPRLPQRNGRADVRDCMFPPGRTLRRPEGSRDVGGIVRVSAERCRNGMPAGPRHGSSSVSRHGRHADLRNAERTALRGATAVMPVIPSAGDGAHRGSGRSAETSISAGG